jgi:hypothetical protein
MIGELYENETAEKTRKIINHDLIETHKIINAAGMRGDYVIYPAPAIGGYVKEIDILTCIFKLPENHVDYNDLIDLLEMTVGVYEKDQLKARVRSINPVYWLFRLIEWIVDIPFRFLGKYFDQSKIESSFIGKLVKILLWLAFTLVPALIVIIDNWEDIRNFLIKVF